MIIKKFFKFLKSFLIIFFITFSLSLVIDFFFGKKILKMLDSYLITTEFYGRLLRIDHPVYHHDLLPGVEYKHNSGFEGKFTICTNNHGFRDDCKNKNVEKEFDIGFMGDSFVEGSSVNFEDSFVGKFANNKKNLKVVNLAVSSYSPKIYFSKINYLLENNFKFNEIIFFIDISDLYDDDVDYKLNNDKTISEKDLKGKNLKRRKFLRSNFPFTNFYMYVLKKSRQIKTNITPIDNKTPKFNSKANYKAEWTYFKGSNHPEYLNSISEAQKNQIEIMNSMYSLLKENNIKMSLVVYPWPQQLLNDNVNSNQVKMWEEFCASKCENFINFFPFFFKEMDKYSFLEIYKKYYFWNDVHFNKNGNEIIAKRLLNIY